VFVVAGLKLSLLTVDHDIERRRASAGDAIGAGLAHPNLHSYVEVARDGQSDVVSNPVPSTEADEQLFLRRRWRAGWMMEIQP
jgi:hypothetical protein